MNCLIIYISAHVFNACLHKSSLLPFLVDFIHMKIIYNGMSKNLLTFAGKTCHSTFILSYAHNFHSGFVIQKHFSFKILYTFTYRVFLKMCRARNAFYATSKKLQSFVFFSQMRKRDRLFYWYQVFSLSGCA